MIYFDLSPVQPLRGFTHGGGEYARAVFKAVLARDSQRKVLWLVDANRDLPDDIQSAIREKSLKCASFRSLNDMQAILSSSRGHRFFSALPYHLGGLNFDGLEAILTIHGLRPVEMPTDRMELRYARNVKDVAKWAVKQILTQRYVDHQIRSFQAVVSINAARTEIVVPSEHTRLALIERLGVSPSSIRVLYSPVTDVIDSPVSDPTLLHELGLRRRRYLLFVSGNRWIKNTYRALCALKSLCEKSPVIRDFDVLVVGGLPVGARVRGIPGLKVLPYVERSQLRSLYAGAFALVYPTLNEGFGYPPLESMACGTPVICSDCCSLPEIAGDAPLYFHPTSTMEIAARIEQLVADTGLWSEMCERGLNRVAVVRQRQEEDLARLCDLILGE